jgi:hypothetical protein
MPTTPVVTKNLPLPLRVFSAAMERQLSLDAYAQSLGISSESLRAVFTAQINHLDSAILDQLADIYDLSHEALRDQLQIVPPQESFAAWLKRNMEGISQHALRTRVQLDAKTLRRFLNAEMLPDSDQSERISRALYIDRMEIARVVTANMVHQADAERLVATTGIAADQRAASPAVTAEATRVRSQRTRRQNTTFDVDPATVQGAAPAQAVVVEPALEGKDLRPAGSRRQAGTKRVDAAREHLTAREDERPRRPATRREAGRKIAQPSPSTPASPIDTTRDSTATIVERSEHPTVRGRTTLTTVVPAMTPTTPSPTNLALAPAAEAEQPRPRITPRQAGTTVIADRKTITARNGRALAQQDNPTAAATDSEAIPALNAPNQATPRKQRRARPVSKQAAADTTPPTMIAPVMYPPDNEGTVEVDPSTETVLIAAPTPAAILHPAELAIETDGALPRVSPLNLPDLHLPTSDAPAAPAASAIAALPPAPVTATSVLPADTTTLQLTADEARLIRHWRQLHPHGRRATLHYIGSLLVDG